MSPCTARERGDKRLAGGEAEWAVEGIADLLAGVEHVHESHAGVEA